MNLLQIGFGREDFTPTEFPISNNSTRYVTEVGDSIFASCLALRWEDLTVLQFSLDLRNLYDKDYARVLAVIAEKTGIPPECILLSATHNHSAPDISLNDRPACLPCAVPPSVLWRILLPLRGQRAAERKRRN